MTPAMPETGLTDLGALANTYGLIPTTPAWSRVEAAMRRMAAIGEGEGAAVSTDDARLVGDYRRALHESRAQVALGYACAAVLAATAQRAGRTVTVSDALRTLSSALLLTQKQPAEVLSLLVVTAGDLVELQLPGSAALETLRSMAQTIDAPLDLARAVVIATRNAAATSPLDWARIDTAGWRALRERAIALVRRRELQPVRGAEIACRVAERPLSSALRIHIDRSTAAEWSSALLRGIEGLLDEEANRLVVQHWLAATASVALGLPAALGRGGERAVIAWLRERTGASGEALGDLVSVIEGSSVPAGGRLLLLSSNVLEKSLVAEWPPAAGGCTIVLRHEEMLRLLETGLPRVLQSVQPLRLVLAVEVTGERTPAERALAERALAELAERVGRDGAARVLIARERFTSDHGIVIPAPRSAEELWDIVESQTRLEKS
jgi:hypothetical protein